MITLSLFSTKKWSKIGFKDDAAYITTFLSNLLFVCKMLYKLPTNMNKMIIKNKFRLLLISDFLYKYFIIMPFYFYQGL